MKNQLVTVDAASCTACRNVTLSCGKRRAKSASSLFVDHRMATVGHETRISR